MSPHNRHFSDFETRARCEKQHFHVEEAVATRQRWKNPGGCLLSETLEPTLGIAETAYEEKLCKQTERDAEFLAIPRLTSNDAGLAKRARAHRDVEPAKNKRTQHARELIDRRRLIGISEKYLSTAGSHHSRADGPTFSLIGRQP